MMNGTRLPLLRGFLFPILAAVVLAAPMTIAGKDLFPRLIDVSVGADNRAQVLSTGFHREAVVLAFGGSQPAGNEDSFGPYTGWAPRAVAEGSDGWTRMLWTHESGAASLWRIAPAGVRSSFLFDPMGWSAVDVSACGDGTSHLLWTDEVGQAMLMRVSPLGEVIGRATYGPYGDWRARSIADGQDDATRLLWSNPDGRIGLSRIVDGVIVATHRFAPPPGFTAQDLTMASDGQARILMSNLDGDAGLWSVDDAGAVTKAGPFYRSPGEDEYAIRASAGVDGRIGVLWDGAGGNGTLWMMDLENVRVSSFRIVNRCLGCWDD